MAYNTGDPNHFLFLYTRLPDYFLQCIRHLLDTCPAGSRAWVVHYESDQDAPYEHVFQDNRISFIGKSSFQPAMMETIRPDLIYVAGWGDPVYKSITAAWKKKLPVVMGLDNPWLGSPRQWMAALLAPLLIKPYCTHLWVTGPPQYTFGRRLGFSKKQLISGLYCADTKDIIPSTLPAEAPEILYTGRMVGYKRPDWLLKAFTEILNLDPALGHWRLTLVGQGPLKQELEANFGKVPAISFIPFLQPAAVKQRYAGASIFCLPSHHEHWGVVVQEAAAAGLPLLLSDTVAAGVTFLENGRNGYQFKSPSYEDFREKLHQLMKTSTAQRIAMGDFSRQLSARITHDSWAAALKSVFVDKHT
ncbi:MAG: glycosyltransferase family 4 protein [Candidatus Pseudobacter hemicellulosilyticus]|uniref:Glycosyltransferase family 4 protein n=1 Tax=Candidatus Pseudobacter hemicellulosilyticus TaxID=3121375 RepID=A0AAJ5WT27_9BACT|nr:MAG: glycosyltransferase family 4 protein [Pseudobacter sp.]